MNNRAALVFPLLLLLGATPLSAQVGALGLKGGVNLTNFVGSDAGDTEQKQRLRMGGSIVLLNLGPLSITPEVYYAQKGARQLESPEGETAPRGLDLSLEYIEVPVLVKLSIPLSGSVRRYVRPYLGGGAAYAWKIGCELRVVATSESLPDCGGVLAETFGGARKAIRNADKGFVLGSGIELNLPGYGVVSLDARLVQGLDRLGGAADAPNVQNQAFSLMLGYSPWTAWR